MKTFNEVKEERGRTLEISVDKNECSASLNLQNVLLPLINQFRLAKSRVKFEV